ncbi:uncharacterized protein LOC111816074 [Octodon degus]|uniref:Uncharacterized protein LOC111816074 n=1 Tax=Octodon degus TaxID=10160 RepID=A0A6P6E7Y8_OCTDE|nr:uncharacterized protein LOC111816074 [Octodon degus]
MAAANSNTRLVATAAAALRPRRPRPPALQTWALPAHSTGSRRRRRRRRRSCAAEEGGDAGVAGGRAGQVRNQPGQGGERSGPPPRPQAPALGRGDLHGGRRPGPRAGPLLPAGCDRSAPELRVAGGVRRQPRAPRRRAPRPEAASASALRRPRLEETRRRLPTVALKFRRAGGEMGLTGFTVKPRSSAAALHHPDPHPVPCWLPGPREAPASLRIPREALSAACPTNPCIMFFPSTFMKMT